VLARELHGELDVVLARKLRAPFQPELAIGAVGEDGAVYLDPETSGAAEVSEDYLRAERERQIAEIAQRRRLFRAVRAPADAAGRSVILTDDGIATGSTLQAALHVLRARQPREVTLAVPVAAPEALERLRRQCDRVLCLLEPAWLGAISMFYEDFAQVEDDEAVRLLREFGRPAAGAAEKARGHDT
jgi:predicted phosphoribosyltransferase